MKRRTAISRMMLAATLVWSGCGDGGAADRPAAAPDSLVRLRPAPPFALETLDGDTLRLADLAEKQAVLLNFWASWCAPCKAEIPDLIEIDAAYRDRGLATIGVAVNDLPRDSRAFVDEMEIPYPSVIGTPAMLEDYGVSPWLPTTLLVADGAVVREWVGPRTRADFEYPVRVALGLAPPLEDVLEGGEPDQGR